MKIDKKPKYHILDIVKSNKTYGQVRFIEINKNKNFQYYFISDENGQKYINSILEENLTLVKSFPEQKFSIGETVIIENFDLYKGLNGRVLNYDDISQEYQISVIGESFELILQEKDLRLPNKEELEQIRVCGITL